MAATALIHCDFTNGDDGTGTGTAGNPYKTVQVAVDNADPVGNSRHEVIMIANTSAQVLAAEIDWVSFGSASITFRLAFSRWDNGGALTINSTSGAFVAGEIDGNDAVATIFSTTSRPDYVGLFGLKIFSTTGILITANTTWSAVMCDFSDASGSALVSQCRPLLCYFHDDGGSSVNGFTAGGAGAPAYCYFENLSGQAFTISDAEVITQNTIKNTNEDSAAGDDLNWWLFNNFIGDGDAGTSGLRLASSNLVNTVLGNQFVGFSAAGQLGLEVLGDGSLLLAGWNSFFDNTTDISAVEMTLDLTANDVSEGSDPFTDSANDDFELTSGASSRGAGPPFIVGPTSKDPLANLNIGAFPGQVCAAAGGGSSNPLHGPLG